MMMSCLLMVHLSTGIVQVNRLPMLASVPLITVVLGRPIISAPTCSGSATGCAARRK